MDAWRTTPERFSSSADFVGFGREAAGYLCGMHWQRWDLRNRLAAEELVGAYLREDARLAPLVTAFPSNAAAVAAWQASMQAGQGQEAQARRAAVVARMERSYAAAGLACPDSLADFAAGAATVVTGHQLCIAGGPAFVQAKLATTIRLARDLSQRVGHPVVPVFWLAGEDHDWAEVDHGYREGEEDAWRWQPAPDEVPVGGAVGRRAIDGSWVAAVRSGLTESGWRPEDARTRWEAGTDGSGQPAGTWTTAMLRMVHADFGRHGVLVLDADDPELKGCALPLWEREIRQGGLASAVERANGLLVTGGWEPAAHVRAVNAFELRDNARVRLERLPDGGIGPVDGAWQRSVDAQVEAVRQAPEAWSPNVLLRPLYQQWLLDPVATVGGPGETAYWLQLKPAFDQSGLRFPLVVLRDSWVALPAAAAHWLRDQGWEGEDWREADWQRRLLEPHEAALRAAAGLPGDWEAFAARLAAVSQGVDATLEGAARAACARMEQELEGLQKKWRKALRLRLAPAFAQAQSVLRWTHPGGTPQERRLSLGELAARPLAAPGGLQGLIDEAVAQPFSWSPSLWVITGPDGLTGPADLSDAANLSDAAPLTGGDASAAAPPSAPRPKTVGE